MVDGRLRYLTVEPQLSRPHLLGFSVNRTTEMTALLGSGCSIMSTMIQIRVVENTDLFSLRYFKVIYIYVYTQFQRYRLFRLMDHPWSQEVPLLSYSNSWSTHIF